MTPLLKVESLSLQFDQLNKKTLNNISFELVQGESLLLLGASGSGKSTLTYCLNGLYPRELEGHLQGKVFINGKDTNDFAPGELSQYVGIVFQDPETQFCMLSVEDEVAFGLENLCVSHHDMETRVDCALELVGMLDYKKAALSTLSGGQKQKLALACILALEPKLIILDEPTANLDPIAAKNLITTIQTLQKRINCSLIIIEHQLDSWTNITERSLLLNREGEIFFDGNLREAIANKYQILGKEGIWLPKVTQYIMQANQHKLINYDIPFTVKEFSQQPLRWSPVFNEKQKQISLQEKQVLIEAKKLNWHVKERTIIRDVSLQLFAGEFVAVLGANGSGKTSLSRLLAGLQKPSSGSVLVDEKNLQEWSEDRLRDKIGYVFQNPEHQFITQNVYDEVAFSLKVKGIKEEVIREKVQHILSLCDLEHLEYEHPFTLSQGQKRRLSVATMIIDDQKLLVLDEPTFGQDARSTKELMKLLQKRYETGTSIMMITHDMDLVYEYATRVIIMNDGHIVADMNPKELWEVPAKKLREWQLTHPIPIQLENIYERELSYASSSS